MTGSDELVAVLNECCRIVKMFSTSSSMLGGRGTLGVATRARNHAGALEN